MDEIKASEKRLAEGILISKNILAGLFPVLTIIAYTNSLPPFAALAWGSAIATILFFVIVTIKKEWSVNLKKVEAIKDISIAVFLIAIVVFGLTFLALNYTSAQNASLLGLLEVMTSFIILGFIMKKEPTTKMHISGAMLMLLSAGIVLFGHQTSFNLGDILILISIVIAPIGNMFAKKALHQVSSMYFMFLRSFASVIVFSILHHFFENPVSSEILISSIPYLLFSGIVYLGIMRMAMVFGYKSTSVTHTISLGSLKPIFAFIFAWILLGQAPTTVQIAALLPSLIGLYLLTKAKQKNTTYGKV